ncbi:N-acetyltransferase [Drechslerella dactyloides]|uniref:N-acetyltransferase n=1 Tax=Drechslerella dactyloides TaxID=74499 RepID=A0AAD6IYT7_DREDA|nr:N-acetyltransferase [Drechslerella dactyloides]
MASSALRTAKRPVATYAKKHRSYLDRRNDTRDDDAHSAKRARLSPAEGENSVESAGNETADSYSPGHYSDEVKRDNSTGSSQADDEEEDDGTTSATTAGTNGSTATSKPTAFTISTRRRPLFKRNTAKSTPPTTSSTKQQQQQKLVQMQIDLDGVGAPRITCRDCGMSYIPSAAEDAKLHKRYHARVAEGLEFGTARRETIVWEGDMLSSTPLPAARVATPREKENGASGPIQRFFSSSAAKGGEGGKLGRAVPSKGHAAAARVSAAACCVVVEITRRSTPTERKKAAEFLRFANQELSAQEVPDKVLWSVSSPATGDGNIASEAAGERFKIYMYLEGTKCVGLCLAESIQEAQWAQPQTDCDDNDTGGIGISCSLTVSQAKEPALLGISRIWTSPKHRRRGVASRLVDCAAENFVYGMKMEAENVAFSQPTDSGACLALRWIAARGKPGPEVPNQDKGEGEPGCEDGRNCTGFLVYFDSV